MERIKKFDEIAHLFQSPGSEHQQTIELKDKELLVEAVNLGQMILAEEVSYLVEQIKTSIDLNDGNFCHLIDELEESLQGILTAKLSMGEDEQPGARERNVYN